MMQRVASRSRSVVGDALATTASRSFVVSSLAVTAKHRRCGGIFVAKRCFNGGGKTTSNGASGGSSRSSFFAWYSKKLDTHPVTTKCISAGLISSVGNALAQRITHHQDEQERLENRTQHKDEEERPFTVDFAQVARFALLNVAFVAPVLHHWYQFINRTLPGKNLSRVVQRTFWDEFVFSPMYIPVFLGMLWKLEGNSHGQIWNMTKSEVPNIIVAEWVTWVPTMLVTFRYVPVKFQVLVINVVGVAWQTFLAYMANNAHANAAKEEGKQKEKHVVTATPQEDDEKPGYLQGPVIAATSTASGSLRFQDPETAADCSVEEEYYPSQMDSHDNDRPGLRRVPKCLDLDYSVMLEDEYR